MSARKQQNSIRARIQRIFINDSTILSAKDVYEILTMDGVETTEAYVRTTISRLVSCDKLKQAGIQTKYGGDMFMIKYPDEI